MLSSQTHCQEVGSQRLQLLIKGALQHPVQPLSSTACPQQNASLLKCPAVVPRSGTHLRQFFIYSLFDFCKTRRDPSCELACLAACCRLR